MSIDPRFYDIIVAPVITEKATMASEHNKVVFKVARNATKPQIKEAVEKLFDVKAADPKTKGLIARFDKLGLKNALIIGGAEIDRNFGLAARNIHNIDVLPVQGINVYDIMRRETLVLTKAAIDALEARFK